jgi:hypothetical protein
MPHDEAGISVVDGEAFVNYFFDGFFSRKDS